MIQIIGIEITGKCAETFKVYSMYLLIILMQNKLLWLCKLQNAQ